jgi:cytochrome c553
MQLTFKRVAIALVVAGIAGVIVLVSGIVPVKASSGHWPITAWLLDFASDRSVALHSMGIKPPKIDDSDAIILGATTYESNCKFCHGQPGEGRPPVAKAMTPTPPMLDHSVDEIRPRELFYIVKHGIKFAGMPAWPTQTRDDEIWPVVAFLQTFPSIDNDEYRDLIAPPTDVTMIEHCVACHGESGNGRAGNRVPVLAGQNDSYLRQSLLAYRRGRRNSGIMMPIAHRLTDNQISRLASYYAEQPREPRYATDSEVDTRQHASIENGRRLANHGDRNAKIPSCVDCHGDADSEVGQSMRADDYPILAGQPAWYLEKQLVLFADRQRGGTEDASLMHPIADKLDAETRHDLAVYYAKGGRQANR